VWSIGGRADPADPTPGAAPAQEEAPAREDEPPPVKKEKTRATSDIARRGRSDLT
jgi:hypothetical protein